MRKTILTAFCLLFYTSFWANNPPLGGWLMYIGNTSFNNSNWKISYDLQYRNHEIITDLNQLLIRTSAQYTILENLTLGAGYAFVHSEHINTPNAPFHENRIFQDVVTQQGIGTSVLKHRFRFEQRFIENQDFKARARYQLGLDVPIFKNEDNNSLVYATAYNELFMNLDKTRKTNAFDRNRLFLGAGYKFNKNVAIQLGWMNQMLQKQSYQQLLFSLHHNLKI